MSLLRRTILVAAQNQWLREQAPRYGFFRRTTKRFMPGEKLEDALAAARELAGNQISTVLTHLGENIADRAEAEGVTQGYLDVLDRIRASELPTEISVKLTQLGLDLDREFCFKNVARLIEHCPPEKTLWIDMEQSQYVDATLELYRRARKAYKNVGVCVQAYLYRTQTDLETLIPLGAAIRLVKGAYNEPREIAFPKKEDVDENYYRLGAMLLNADALRAGVRAAIATHDRALIKRICDFAASQGIAKERLEFQMLYGIRRGEQLRLAQEGYRSTVLISYGSFWFPWFMRRLAERPANILFLARNFFSK
ncbi:MAG: proline dehydrogenase family protein [Candidatus Acidiferrales bacterium]